MAPQGRVIGLIAFLLIVSSSGICRAQEVDRRAAFDLRRLIADGAALLQQGASSSLLPPEAPRPAGEQTFGHRGWFGGTPRFSFVARDWDGAQGVGGTMVTDELRRSRSSRMVVGRVRLAGGQVAPFVQVGLGQWRVDPEIIYGLPQRTELAAQLTFGFELRTGRRSALGMECDYTAFYREHRRDQTVPMAGVLGAYAAAKIQF